MNFSTCRTVGHSWDHIPSPPQATGRSQSVDIRLRCTRCATERTDMVAVVNGAVVKRRYVYPAGYQTSKDDRLAKNEWRRLFMMASDILDQRGRVKRK